MNESLSVITPRSATPARRKIARQPLKDAQRHKMTEVTFCVRGVLSPLLSNILLNDLGGVRAFLDGALKLRVNAEKSAVARPWEPEFLWFSVTKHRENRLRIAPPTCND